MMAAVLDSVLGPGKVDLMWGQQEQLSAVQWWLECLWGISEQLAGAPLPEKQQSPFPQRCQHCWRVNEFQNNFLAHLLVLVEL